MANEWAGRGVQINAVASGYLRTEVTRQVHEDHRRNQAVLHRIPTGRRGAPEEVVGPAVFLAFSASDQVNGHVLAVKGGSLAR